VWSNSLRVLKRDMEYQFDEISYYRLTEWQKKRVVETAKNLLEVDERVKLAYIFGGFTRRSSIRDVDIAVYAVPPFSFGELLSLNAKMELKLGLPVDLVQLQDLDPVFRLKILRYGLSILVGDGQLYHSLLAQAFSESWDLDVCRKDASRFVNSSLRR